MRNLRTDDALSSILSSSQSNVHGKVVITHFFYFLGIYILQPLISPSLLLLFSMSCDSCMILICKIGLTNRPPPVHCVRVALKEKTSVRDKWEGTFTARRTQNKQKENNNNNNLGHCRIWQAIYNPSFTMIEGLSGKKVNEDSSRLGTQDQQA